MSRFTKCSDVVEAADCLAQVTCTSKALPRNTRRVQVPNNNLSFILSLSLYLDLCIPTRCTRTMTQTQTHTLGRTPLDEIPHLRRDLYLTTNNTHKIQKSMPSVGFELVLPATERPQAQTLERAVTRIGFATESEVVNFFQIICYGIYMSLVVELPSVGTCKKYRQIQCQAAIHNRVLYVFVIEYLFECCTQFFEKVNNVVTPCSSPTCKVSLSFKSSLSLSFSLLNT